MASLDLPVGAVATGWDTFVLRDGDPVMVVGFKQTALDPQPACAAPPVRARSASLPAKPLLIFPIAAERRPQASAACSTFRERSTLPDHLTRVAQLSMFVVPLTSAPAPARPQPGTLPPAGRGARGRPPGPADRGARPPRRPPRAGGRRFPPCSRRGSRRAHPRADAPGRRRDRCGSTWCCGRSSSGGRWRCVFAFAAPVALAIACVLHARRRAALIGGAVVAAAAPPCRCTSARASAGARSRSTDCRDAFDGYRIVQISDLHCGPFASGRRVARWVAAANRLEPDLVAVTGDLIANGDGFIDTVAQALGGLRARDGAFAAMGNHDYFGNGEAMVRALEGGGPDRAAQPRRRAARANGAIYLAASTTRGRGGTMSARALAGGRRACPRCCSRTIRCSFRSGGARRRPGALGPHPRRSGGGADARAQAQPRAADHAVHERRVPVRDEPRCT